MVAKAAAAAAAAVRAGRAGAGLAREGAVELRLHGFIRGFREWTAHLHSETAPGS